MNGKQSKRLRAIVYGKEFSFRHRHYMWDKPPTWEGPKGEEVLITGSIQSDVKRKLYKQIKKFFNQGSSLQQIKLLVNEVQS